MKKPCINSFFYLLIIAMCFSCATTNKSKSKIKKEDLLDVDEVFKKVNEDIVKALSAEGVRNGNFMVSSIDLSFSTVTSNTGGVDVKLWVISSSVSRTKAKTYNTTFTIAKPQDKIDKSEKSIKPTDFSNYILNSIKAAQTINPINDLALTEFVVNVEYSITKSLDGTIGIVLTPVEIGPKASTESTITHSIAITFVKSN